MNMEIQEMAAYANALKPEDIVWKSLYPNDMPENGLMGYTADLELPDGSGGRRYTILFQNKEDEQGCSLEDVELYVLFERVCSGSDSFVRAFRTLDEAKARAALQFQMVYGYAMSYLLDDK